MTFIVLGSKSPGSSDDEDGDGLTFRGKQRLQLYPLGTLLKATPPTRDSFTVAVFFLLLFHKSYSFLPQNFYKSDINNRVYKY